MTREGHKHPQVTSNWFEEAEMSAVGIAMFTVLLTVVTYLFWRLSVQRKLVRQLRDEQRILAEGWRAEQDDLSRFIGSRTSPFITIEILNAIELVSQTTSVGGLIGKFAPGTIHRMVVRRTADTLRDQMTDHGVQVKVVVHGLN